MADFDLSDYGINQAGNVEVQDALADHVRTRFNDAVLHKRSIGIESQLLRNLRANKCQYQPDEIGLLGPFNDIYMGICALKARAAESWLTDIILNNIDKPWTLSPTPIPTLPEDQKEQVVDLLLREIEQFRSVEALRDRARDLKGAHAEIAYAEAEKRTSKMETQVSDQLAEGDWTPEFSKLIADIVAYPTALMRGPIVVGRTVGTWDGKEYKPKKTSLPTVRTVSPFDAFPAPNATSCQDGEYFCERTRYSVGALYSLIGVDGFNSGNIRQVLDRYPEGFSYELMGDSERQRLEDKSPTGSVGVLSTPSRDLETVIYNGKVPGKLLAEHGIVVKDVQNGYEAEVYQIGGGR